MTLPPDAIVGEDPPRIPNIPHKTVPMTYCDEVVEIDENIAPLIRELWRLGICTSWCCEGYPNAVDYRRKAYIIFERCTDAEFFLQIVHSKSPDPTDRLRQSGTPPKCNQYIWRTDPGICWEYEADLYDDSKLYNKPILRICLRFPHEDIQKLCELLREYYKELNG